MVQLCHNFSLFSECFGLTSQVPCLRCRFPSAKAQKSDSDLDIKQLVEHIILGELQQGNALFNCVHPAVPASLPVSIFWGVPVCQCWPPSCKAGCALRNTSDGFQALHMRTAFSGGLQWPRVFGCLTCFASCHCFHSLATVTTSRKSAEELAASVASLFQGLMLAS